MAMAPSFRSENEPKPTARKSLLNLAVNIPEKIKTKNIILLTGNGTHNILIMVVLRK